jgi:hypothetical protein
MPPSELRARLRERLEEFDRLVRSLDLHRSQIRASLYRHHIRCGHPGCHCAQGPGHPRWCLSFASPRGRHTRSLSPQELHAVQAGAEAYRCYRQIRSQAAKKARQIFDLIDRLGETLERPVEGALKGGR